MAATGKKIAKQTHPRRRVLRKRIKKTKKAASRDFWQALALTAILIAASAAISLMILGGKRGSQYVNPLPAPDIIKPEITAEEMPTLPQDPPVQDKVPAEQPAAVPKPPQEKQSIVKPAPTAKTPEKNTPVRPQSQPEKAPAQKPENRVPPKITEPKPRTESLIELSVRAPPELPPKPKYQGTLVFIIDDAGNNLQELEPFLRFPGPLTIAVLPGLPHSVEAARRIRAAGKEVFLHQPMEAIGGQNPGPGAIYAGMTTAEILAILSQNLREIGPVAGINNHQGSKITADQQMMETVLTFCHEQGIHFLDSRTTAETAVPAAARNLGMKIGQRNIFIDNEQNRSAMNRSVESGLLLASQNGSAVMIGHTWSPDLAPLLAELHQNLIAQGYTLATASEIINRVVD
jgi:polysaccharide deacetylase 2 family uncharacterized protein YibQ